jgi:hypothetical protein
VCTHENQHLLIRHVIHLFIPLFFILGVLQCHFSCMPHRHRSRNRARVVIAIFFH